jgi:hypothetical protein
MVIFLKTDRDSEAIVRYCTYTMSDQEFEMFREFVILDFLSFLKTPILQILPDHL